MKKVGVAILGLGVVGGGTYKILSEHREQYKKSHGVDIVVESVLERSKERALSLGIEENRICSNIAEICSNPEIDIVVEVIGGIEPAKTFVLAALNSGKSVVTSNKELYCKYSHQLEKTAKKNRVGLFYEATCVGGVPVIRAMLDNLQGNNFTSIMGIINGTTNYILSKMSQSGAAYKSVLEEAKKLGYAEADPTSDVEGYDAAYKLSILSSLAFHTKIPFTEIYREGIDGIDNLDIEYGKRLGYSLKLLAIGKTKRAVSRCAFIRLLSNQIIRLQELTTAITQFFLPATAWRTLCFTGAAQGRCLRGVQSWGILSIAQLIPIIAILRLIIRKRRIPQQSL